MAISLEKVDVGVLLRHLRSFVAFIIAMVRVTEMTSWWRINDGNY